MLLIGWFPGIIIALLTYLLNPTLGMAIGFGVSSAPVILLCWCAGWECLMAEMACTAEPPRFIRYPYLSPLNAPPHTSAFDVVEDRA